MRVLAQEIGPRAPGSSEEGRAAQWCSARLAACGLDVTIDTFESRSSARPWLAAYLGIGAAGSALIAPALFGFVLSLVALVLYARDLEGRPLIEPRGAESTNVLARRGDAAPELVVVAGLDSARASLVSAPGFRPGVRGWNLVLHGALLAAPAAAAAAWVAEAGRPLPAGAWAVAAGLALVEAGGVALELHSERSMALVAGANDNATGVEVILRLARRFDDPRVWWLFTGSDHAGQIGMQAFLRAHAHQLGRARILHLKALGAGSATVAYDEGAFRLRRADGALIDAAVEAGAGSAPYRASQTPAAVAMVHHRRAATILGLDGHGSVPHEGWNTDVAANVDPVALDRAEQVVARTIAIATGARDAGSADRRIDGSSST